MSFRIFILILFALFLTAYSCASKEEKLEMNKAAVDQIKDNLKGAKEVQGLFVKGENRSRFRGYFQDDELLIINEDVSIGYWSGSTNIYFVKDGDFIHYTQKEVGTDGPQSRNKRMINVEIYFDGKNVLEATKVINQKSVDISREEIDGILDHFEALKSAVYDVKPNN